MAMDKGIIFYTDDSVKEPIKSMVLKSIYDSGLPISKSIKPEHMKRCYPTMLKQIIKCLEESTAKYVFFCEHDVIYSKSHFDFTPPEDNIFYYNTNVWRWDYPKPRYFTYDRLISLSGLCVNREFALDHHKRRLFEISKRGYDKEERGEPHWVRLMGYEPGTKKIKRGGFSDDDFDTWRSEEPLIDIRHNHTFSPRKVNIEDFNHKPTGWKETNERP